MADAAPAATEPAWAATDNAAGAAVASGLRHLRVGQRVSVELDEAGRVATRVWVVGIGPGEDIH